MKIYVAYHKDSERLVENSLYCPLHVGKAKSTVKMSIEGDNTGDHISEKNSTFCETTAMYWIWKNTSDDIVGLSHYRRYFSKRGKNFVEQCAEKLFFLFGLQRKRHGLIYAKTSNRRKQQMLDKETTETIFENYDIILPVKRSLKRTIGEQYSIRRPNDDFKIVKEIVSEICPEYSEPLTSMLNDNKIYACNMFVMKKELFDRYMKWLFPILFELEQRVDISNYSLYHQRIYGFIAERLLMVWLAHEKLKIKELPVLYFKGV